MLVVHCAVTSAVHGQSSAPRAAGQPPPAPTTGATSVWSPRLTLRWELPIFGTYRTGHWQEWNLLGLIGAVQSRVFAAELGGRAHMGRGPHTDLFVRVGINPTLLSQSDARRGWSLTLPVLAELARSTVGGDDSGFIYLQGAVLTGLELLHRGERRGWGGRLLVGRKGRWASRPEFADSWTDYPFAFDTTDARFDLSLHFP